MQFGHVQVLWLQLRMAIYEFVGRTVRLMVLVINKTGASQTVFVTIWPVVLEEQHRLLIVYEMN